jgi:hypothetical protein
MEPICKWCNLTNEGSWPSCGYRLTQERPNEQSINGMTIIDTKRVTNRNGISLILKAIDSRDTLHFYIIDSTGELQEDNYHRTPIILTIKNENIKNSNEDYEYNKIRSELKKIAKSYNNGGDPGLMM